MCEPTSISLGQREQEGMNTRQPADEEAKQAHPRRGLRADAPLLNGYLSFRESRQTPFTTPGHKGRASTLDEDLGAAVAGDVPLYGGVDTIKFAGGLLAKAAGVAVLFTG